MMRVSNHHRPAIDRNWRRALRAGVLAVVCALLGSAHSRAQSVGFDTPNSGRDCTVCHLDWMESFGQKRAVNLMPLPASDVVVASETCLGCHDGSIGDSRRQVWVDHGHRTGITPSANMKVPRELPLENGKLTCRTCHTAHSNPSTQGLKDAVFLRVKNESGQLCQGCHADKGARPQSVTHPLGPMKSVAPGSLLDVGAHAGEDNRQLVCQTCHTAHGAKRDDLLLMGAGNSELCVACHEEMRPGRWLLAEGRDHPQNPPLRTDAQRQAIKTMGTRLGDDGTLVCLSCHKVHHGQSKRAMLAQTVSDSALCIRCHPERADLAGSPHDLRKSAPRELNARGMTAQESGPCGACHSFHSYARRRAPRESDPGGLCVTCHSEGQVAAKHDGKILSHPTRLESARLPNLPGMELYSAKDDPSHQSLVCKTCHDPHQTRQRHFLKTPKDALCAQCHPERLKSLAGAHDFTLSKATNGRDLAGADTGKCGFCHSMHESKGAAMWSATRTQPDSADDLCNECHRSGSMAREHPTAKYSHPTGAQVRPSTRPATFALPLFDEVGHRKTAGGVGCSTCHDPHLDNKTARGLLRAAPSELCGQCHQAQQKMAGGPHDARASAKPWPAIPNPGGELCLTCHKAHSNDDTRRTWAVAPAPGANAVDGACIACHPANTWSTSGELAAGAAAHPQTIGPRSPVQLVKHGLPMASRDNPAAASELACRTCHDPHQRGGKWLLRTDSSQSPGDLCSRCHADANPINQSMHSADLLSHYDSRRGACAPCHAVHAVPGSQRKLLWAAKTSTSGRNDSERMCLGCHDGQGDAKRPEMLKHPDTAIAKLKEAKTNPDELERRLAAVRAITCGTCHLSHGRDLPPAPQTRPSPATRASIRVAQPMLRPNVDAEICAGCHGVDAARLHLYFHNPKKRAMVEKMIEH